MARNRIGRVTTPGGDAGMASLADGARHGKHEAAIGAVGALDEANSLRRPRRRSIGRSSGARGAP